MGFTLLQITNPNRDFNFWSAKAQRKIPFLGWYQPDKEGEFTHIKLTSLLVS
jgi:hypothetical protein